MGWHSHGIALLAAALLCAGAARAEERILYFTHSAGYRHEVIPLSADVLRAIGARGGFAVTESEDVAVFAPERLAGFAAVMFFTSGELPMDAAQKAAFLAFVRQGHGFIGVHSATDTFYLWPEYLALIGGYFNEHPWHQEVTVEVAAPGDPIVRHLGRAFRIADEIYQIGDFDARRSRVLLRLDPASVDLGAAGARRRFYGWPLAWTRRYGQGRVFYTALGHEDGVWRDRDFQRMLANAVLWVTRKGP